MKVIESSSRHLILKKSPLMPWLSALGIGLFCTLLIVGQRQELSVHCGPDQGASTCVIERTSPLGSKRVTEVARENIEGIEGGFRLPRVISERQRVTLRTSEGPVTLLTMLTAMSHDRRDTLIYRMTEYVQGPPDGAMSFEQKERPYWQFYLGGAWLLLLGMALYEARPRRLHVDAEGTITLTGWRQHKLAYLKAASVERLILREVFRPWSGYKRRGYPLVFLCDDGREFRMMSHLGKNEAFEAAWAICELLDLPEPHIID